MPLHSCCSFFFFTDTATTEIYTLSLHDALPISPWAQGWPAASPAPGSRSRSRRGRSRRQRPRSEEHTSELQSRRDLVCRLLLEKKKRKKNKLLGLFFPVHHSPLKLALCRLLSN